MADASAFREAFTVTTENPLLRGHVVHGRNLLPGVGYVDLVLQVLARQGHPMPGVELRNLTILAPLVATPGEKVLTVVEGRPAPKGGWRIEVRSRSERGAADVVHAVVSAHRCTPSAFPDRLALPITGGHRTTRLADLYRWLRQNELVHSGLMKMDGVVHHRSEDWVVELELPPAYQATADTFLFHPALFESGLLGGSIGSHMLYQGNEGEGLYLPLVFESFRASAPLGSRCFVRVPAASVHRDDELIRLGVEFYDATGAKIAEVGRLTAKRVRAVTSLDVGGEPAREPVPVPVPVPEPAPAVASARATAPVATASVSAPVSAPAGQNALTTLCELVSTRLEVPWERIDVHRGFYELGLASADLVSLVPHLEDRLSLTLSPTLAFEYRSIAALAARLEECVVEQHGAPAVSTAGNDAEAATRGAVVEEVSALLAVDADEVDPDHEFAEFGFDVTGLAQLAARLNDRFGLALTSAVFAEHRTVRALARLLAAPGGPAPDANGGPASAPDATAARDRQGEPRPHPMLHRAVPDGDGVAYRTRFDGGEPFLRDHRVRGARVLPAVAQLEMARAAVEHTAGDALTGPVRLDDTVWLRPATCGPDGLELQVNVRTLPGPRWEYTIHRVAGDGELILCGKGRASPPDTADRALPSLDALRAACAERSLPAAELYDLYARVGMDYGPAQRSLVRLDLGSDAAGRPQVLAELRLPEAFGPGDGLRLHPSITDGALQAVAGLRTAAADPDGQAQARAALPFALRHVEAFAATPARAYAWIRHRPRSAAASEELDITVLDEDGHRCAELTGLTTRALANAPEPADQASATATPTARDRAYPDRAAARAVTDIAIVGLSGRYPKSPDLDAFWGNLRSGRDCVHEVPPERWDHRRYADVGGSSSGRWGGFLDEIDRFDPLFFQISLHEAELLDPQERLFLQCAHHALEDAGYTGELLARAAVEPDAAAVAPPGRVGVFVGLMYQEYQLYGAQAQERGQAVALSGSASSVANRVSYVYNFSGPSIAVDTMCSSSLTAIHLACEAIKSGQCETALAGGVNIHSHPNKFLLLSQRRFLSSDGRCRSFGEGGDGYVPGEGVGAIVLKPLERAVADGDHIYGVIKGTALNHGGRTSGYSVPSPTAQGEAVAEALTAAGVDPRAISYLEAHGTGTSLGDPIEIVGLTKAFDAHGALPEHCAIGSVKSNIGHCEGAAGIAGVTKVLLQMRHGELVPSLHSATLNPRIDFASTPLRVQQRLEPWHRPTVEIDGERRTVPRIAGVSGFGAGGSNAHVIIAEYEPTAPRPATPATDGRPALLVLSAQSEEQLVEQARRMHARLAELDEDALPDVAWTLQVGRMALDERLAFAATSPADARARLESFLAHPAGPGAWMRGTVRLGAPADDALGAAMADWTDRGAYEALLRQWVDGALVRWETLYPTAPPARRISLPGYPFARDRCWYDLGPAEATSRPLAPADTDAPRPEGAVEGAEMMLLRPVWSVREAGPGPKATGEAFAEHHVVVVGSLAAGESEALRAGLPVSTACQFVDPGDGPLDRQYAEVVQRVFTMARGLLAGGVRRPALLQVALVGAADSDAERERLACFGGLAGLLKTAHLENPLLHTQYVECLDGAAPATVAARLLAEAASSGPEPEVRHRDGRRHVVRWEEVAHPRPAAVPWREGGVYLITGGAGGLGRIVAHEIAASAGHATVVLTGRSPLSEEQRGALNALRTAGLTADYQRADVTDRDAVGRLLAHVADNHGPLTGIVHSAGVIDDAYILRKSPEESARVLAPKVTGLVHLDELSRDQPLEVFLSFASIAGAFGNAGQADYAAGNAFMAGYAAYRNRLVDAGVCHGRTVSIDWPLWEEGGMGGDAVRENLRRAGLAPLEAARGLTALRCAMAPEDNGLADGRLLVVVGERDRLPTVLGGGEQRGAESAGGAVDDATADRGGSAPGGGADRLLEDRAVGHLRRLVASALGLVAERLSPDAPLERYGMDSVIALDVIARLEESFGSLSRTLLFEVETVRELARYFVEDHGEALRALLGVPVPVPVPEWPAPDAPVAEAPVVAAGGAVVREREAAAGSPHSGGGGRGQDVAIVSISGRYPQAEDAEALWARLREGADCVTRVPADRWDLAAVPDVEGARPGVWGGFLEGVDRFDPLHFGISPREAAAMDPQQRLFLETVWHLLERGGVTQEVIERRYRRRVGVYVGAAYQLYRAEESDRVLAAVTSATSYNMIANRVSHFFGLEGPSMAVDAMCASSAMAIHLACADLQRGETELAVAGGINLTLHPDKYLALAEMQLLGSDRGSRSFRDGDGYLPAEAVGAVLLKPLEAAVRDGDEIHAVIRGTASVHGGRSNGFMMPSPRAQVTVMRRALERAGVGAQSIGYVESAANGTALADEVEVRALREVFAGVSEPVAVGTVKSNLGHPEAASGIAQLTKVVLQLRHRQLAPLVAAGAPNPNLDLEGTALRLCETLSDWEPRGEADAAAPRRALINSVAAGGSHVSLVIEAPPRTRAGAEGAFDPGPQLVAVSGRTDGQLRTAARRLHTYLVEHADTVGLADVAYTTQLGREALAERLAVVAGSVEELTQALARYLDDRSDTTDGPLPDTPVVTGNADDGAGPLGSVLTGSRGEALLAGLVADGELEHLAELWVRGVEVPWAGLHRGPRRLVALPATAFESGRYWVGRKPVAANAAAGEAPADSEVTTGSGHPHDPGGLSDTERFLVAAWSELLGIDADQLDARSDFLTLGGNSLLATRLMNTLKARTGVELPAHAVFAAPRLAELAATLERYIPSDTSGTLNAEQKILDSIALVESMSDEELDALTGGN
ncbi:SDR family NAD(P)-dependent oxidoreductase [Streptomyces sp. ME19-01-6]|uniref:SDR family NAD(P)-dependent oxidoreductase n=1 Tax=Streptomyces sp. ME19-01-6 TaxID=3028686 RepID=UPI0029AC8AFE|nr:SDR family NAD(P)-dependent oxidoreductase [Streptomyces sp. ME19-01-6]MDX3229224.1 SDR family NAD(P)-dependent oxidoreductase [Streptomyces sp. ME19-01-6]